MLFKACLAAALVVAPIAATFVPTEAFAQGEGPCTDQKAAKRDFIKGRLAYRRGDYEEAILKWQDSYAACAKALTLFNIGNAYERLGDLKAALSHFERYQPLAEKHERADLDSRMEGLRTRIAAEDQKTAEQQARDEQARLAEEERLRQQTQGQGTIPPRRPSKVVPIIAWTAVGVGGAAVVAGVVMDIIANSSRPDEAQACTTAGDRLLCRDAQRDDIEKSNTLAIAGDVTWIAGAVVAAAGATVLVLTATRVIRVGGTTTERSTIADVRVAPYGPGVQVLGTF